jgi:hypothetical protein
MPAAWDAVPGHGFIVTGRFYASPTGYRCRDELEIRAIGTRANAAADAVFVMMNPGSSAPLDGVEAGAFDEAKYVATRPDSTQYQVMRLMGRQGWRVVRVLNLTDLRTPQSAALAGLVRAYEQDEGHDGHSIFAPARAQALRAGLRRRRGAPVVLAWGMAAGLRPLAERALVALASERIVGWGVPGGWQYRHPLPRSPQQQREWLARVGQAVTPFSTSRTRSS